MKMLVPRRGLEIGFQRIDPEAVFRRGSIVTPFPTHCDSSASGKLSILQSTYWNFALPKWIDARYDVRTLYVRGRIPLLS
jgi:hypothetical protein